MVFGLRLLYFREEIKSKITPYREHSNWEFEMNDNIGPLCYY